jgi:hypothetical protein
MPSVTAARRSVAVGRVAFATTPWEKAPRSAMTAFGGLSPPRRQELALVAHDKERVEALLGRINGPIRAAVRRYDNLAYGRKLGVLPLGQPIRMPRPPALPPVAKM